MNEKQEILTFLKELALLFEKYNIEKCDVINSSVTFINKSNVKYFGFAKYDGGEYKHIGAYIDEFIPAFFVPESYEAKESEKKYVD